jgi:hypothetical protein
VVLGPEPVRAAVIERLVASGASPASGAGDRSRP